MSSNVFGYLDHLPAVPADIVQDNLAIAEAFDPEADAHRKSVNARPQVADPTWHDGKLSVSVSEFVGHPGQKPCFFCVVPSTESFRQWSYANVHPSPLASHVQVQVKGHYTRPHTDFGRRYAVNYLFAESKARTLFYRPKPEFAHLTVSPSCMFPYERLDVIGEMIIEPFRWHWIDVSQIHSVEDMMTSRYAFTVSLKEM